MSEKDINKKHGGAQAADESRVTRGYLLALINSSDNGIVVVNHNGCFEFFNKAFCDIAGRSANQLQSQHFIKFIAPDHRDFVMEQWRQALQGHGKPYDVDIITQNGYRRNIAVSHRSFIFNGQQKISVVIKDITARKKAQQVFLENIQAYSQTIDKIPYGLVVQDQDNVITFVNPAFSKMIGVSDKELIGKTIDSFIDIQDHEPYRNWIKQIRPGGRKPFVLHWQNGDQKAVTLVFPSQVGDRDTQNIFLLLCDITQQQQMLSMLHSQFHDTDQPPNLDAIGLTKTEKKVLAHLLEGKFNKEIAYAMNRSVRTIEFHRANIMHKFDVDNLVDLVRKNLPKGFVQ